MQAFELMEAGAIDISRAEWLANGSRNGEWAVIAIKEKEKDGGKQNLSFGLFCGLKFYKAKPSLFSPNSKIFDYMKGLEII